MVNPLMPDDAWLARWLRVAEARLCDAGLFVRWEDNTLVVSAPRQGDQEARGPSVTIDCRPDPLDRMLLWFSVDGVLVAPAHRSHDLPRFALERLRLLKQDHAPRPEPTDPQTDWRTRFDAARLAQNQQRKEQSRLGFGV